MSLKFEAESVPLAQEEEQAILVREYDEKRDKVAVEDLEKRCEVVQKGKPSIVTDLMGDPIGRIRNFPLYVMLVAEYVKEKEIVGVVRGSIKTVTRGKKDSSEFPVYVKLAYILGLRVSHTRRYKNASIAKSTERRRRLLIIGRYKHICSHGCLISCAVLVVLGFEMRLGVATRLVQQLEEWCRRNGADYAYMATDCSNQASINLFTKKFNYVKFRTPKVLVQPVHVHYKHLGSNIAIVQIPPQLAETFYHTIFANSEFFPKDIDLVLKNKLNLGTFMALPKKVLADWDPRTGKLPPSFAILSIWNTKEVYKLQVKGVSSMKYAFCLGRRVLDGLLPWLKVPSIANVFKSFGFYLLYGLHMEGDDDDEASYLMKSLCAFAHNMARDDGDCGFLVAEVGKMDPISEAIPHWRKYSWDEDVWCIKKLVSANEEDNKHGDYEAYDHQWIQSRISSSSVVIFVDPRDF